jgi:hypothetical protein
MTWEPCAGPTSHYEEACRHLVLGDMSLTNRVFSPFEELHVPLIPCHIDGTNIDILGPLGVRPIQVRREDFEEGSNLLR